VGYDLFCYSVFHSYINYETHYPRSEKQNTSVLQQREPTFLWCMTWFMTLETPVTELQQQSVPKPPRGSNTWGQYWQKHHLLSVCNMATESPCSLLWSMSHSEMRSRRWSTRYTNGSRKYSLREINP
jgi:hypothetical protein